MKIKLKRIIQYVFRIMIFLVISLVFGLTFYTINARRVSGNRLVMPFNKTIAVVLTGSMEPTIGVNDLIVVEKTNDYEVNDIVVYQTGNMLVVHRIIAIDGEMVITAGDNNDGEDTPINIKSINGEVVDIIPHLGLVLKIVKSPIGLVVIVTLAVILLILSYKKEKKEENKDIDSIKEEIERLKKEVNNNKQ
ncbi:MAG: signal peptidase I [Erysipelotrichaceae bacterium]|nr:signal peptidase I [Erysipelotrichaceae bacterium]